MESLDTRSKPYERMIEPSVSVFGDGNRVAQEIVAGTHRLNADEPSNVGGMDLGPTPYDLLLGALGACTSMTLGMYARRQNWPLERVVVRIRHSKVHAEDCVACESRGICLTRLSEKWN